MPADKRWPRAPRGGTSSMSVPLGAELDATYAVDDWGKDEPAS